MPDQKPREIAAQVLRGRLERPPAYVEALLDEALTRAELSRLDRALAQELVFGVVRWQAALDWLIARKAPGRTQKPDLQILLRLGLYQLFWLDRVPDHAAVHETVQLAKELGLGAQSGFLNAVLRGYLRERDQTQRALEDLKRSEPALGYSHPTWLCERLQKRWDAGQVRALLAWNNTPAPVFARVNTLRTDAAQLAEQFALEGVKAIPRTFDWVPDERSRTGFQPESATDEKGTTGKMPLAAGWKPVPPSSASPESAQAALIFELPSPPPLTALTSFQQGHFYVQDPSTLLAVTMLDPQPGESILDFCAAPGGKTTYIAQRMQNRGQVVAQDIEVRRRQLIEENCRRLGVTCVTVSRATAAVHDELSEPFDRVLVDAPCSNTGVLRRRVDLRWRLQPSEIERLRALQIDLLTRAVRQLKPGGTLVYSTCSLEPEENRGVVDAFLTAHPGIHLERERELLPFNDAVDGAYVARLATSR